MASSSLKRFAPYAAVVGLAGLLAAAVLWLLRREVDVPVQVSLAVGLLGLALALLFNPSAVQGFLMGRQARYGGNVLIMVAALFGILVLVNYLVRQNPQRWDWSEDQSNTLSPETLALIAALPEPVKAIGFFSNSQQMASSITNAQTLLERYRIELGDKITLEFHDPFAEPALVEEYNVTTDGTLILEMGENRETVNFASEAEITGALSRLMNPVAQIVYYATGSGERDFVLTDQSGYSQVGSLLGNQNYELRPVNLALTDTVPSDATALVLAGSQVPVTVEVVQVIKAYVDGGGQLLVLSDPPIQFNQPISVTEPLADYLRADWGIDLGRDVVLATQSSLEGQPYVIFAGDYGSHAITQDFRTIGSLYDFTRSVTLTGAQAANPAITLTPLVLAGPDAWGEVTLDDATQPAQQGPEDVQPVVNIGVAGENSATGARLVVYGDSDFASNTLFNQGANGRLFVASVNWAANDEDLISITPRVPTTRTLVPLEALALRAIAFFSVLIMPLFVLVIGAVVWFSRRRRG